MNEKAEEAKEENNHEWESRVGKNILVSTELMGAEEAVVERLFYDIFGNKQVKIKLAHASVWITISESENGAVLESGVAQYKFLGELPDEPIVIIQE